ncbi:MAG: hypothetical protein AAGA92_16185 [Planctomycetota bacterium]
MRPNYTGYDHDNEDFAGLFEESQRYGGVCGAGEGLAELDPTTWLREDLQFGWPSCVGFGSSKAVECVHYFATGGEEVQLSEMWAWVKAQVHGGSRPSVDRGASIYGSIKALKQVGIPAREFAPYTYGDYYSQFTEQAEKDAAARLVRSSWRFDSYEAILDFLKGGVGSIITGLPWGRGGWHCTNWCGFTREGEIIEANSHRGDTRNVYSPKEVERFLRVRGTVIYGVSDLEVPVLRTFDHRETFLP